MLLFNVFFIEAKTHMNWPVTEKRKTVVNKTSDK